MKQILLVSILSLICGGLGIAGGWFAGFEKGKSFVEEKEEGHDDHEKPAISETALENMGIVVGPAKLSNFSKYRTILAVVEELVTTSQPVFAPVGGHIEKIAVKQYELVKKKQVVVSLIRDAIPRIDLTLTGDILKPATEEMHESLAKFRRAVKNLEILEAELQRIQKYSKSEITDAYPIVPQKRIIELNYEITRAQQEIAIVQEELARHGLSESQVGKLGKLPRIDAQIWNKTLKSHGLWPSTAEKLYQVLPEDIQKLHWTMATISELVAAGLVKRDLYMWLKKNRDVGAHFLEIGGLLQRGNSLDKIRHMYELNVFNSVVEISAPDNVDSWDVEEILIKKHQVVEEGQHLITLKNPQILYLVARPEGSERNLTLNALQNNLKVQASPLLEEEGPTLKDLEIENIVSDKKTGAMRAYIQIKNEVFKIHNNASGVTRRTWKLRAKQQYILRVPTETMEKVYVFPKDALAEDGPNKIMFLQNGDHFRPIEVKVLYQDHEFVVISNKADIFPGDIVVYQGAFALGLALKSSSGTDAGHGHGHGH